MHENGCNLFSKAIIKTHNLLFDYERLRLNLEKESLSLKAGEV
jgi:hypothetical protein